MKKFIVYLFVLMLNFIITNSSFASNLHELDRDNARRALISKLKGGDYTNAGDTKGIDFVLDRLSNYSLKDGNILDLGSGYGGGADYLYKNGFTKIWGVDINKNAVDYANLKYSHMKFFHLDAKNITKKFRKEFFSFIFAFNILYAVEDKETLVKALTKVSKKGAIITIFDYSKTDVVLSSKDKPMKDLGGSPMHPIEVESLTKILEKSGWRVNDSIDITDKYIEWYDNFLGEFSQKRSEMMKTHKEKDVEDIENLFNKILFNLRNKYIGGHLLIAEKL
jgi:SAM-dependent methyltransferase